MGPQEDYIEAVVTCEGDYHDPCLQDRLRSFQERLESLLLDDEKEQLILKKVEPWNSVRVTFSIPRQAALRLKQLAEEGSASLRQIGVLGVQIQGDHLVSLTVATSNNQRAELVISTHDGPCQGMGTGAAQTATARAGLQGASEEVGSPGPNMEVTRKNIEEYLRQGGLFNSVLAPISASGQSVANSSVFKVQPSSADGGSFHNVAVASMSGPSTSSGFPGAFALHGNQKPAAFTSIGNVGVGDHPSSCVGTLQHVLQHQPKYQVDVQKHQQLQASSQTVALPQTAALGYGMTGLPPPPPYPHGHGAGLANNISRRGKKGTASSPLLINLLQTDPLAGPNNTLTGAGSEEKVKKKRRKRKSKAAESENSDGQLVSPTLPVESCSLSQKAPPQTVPSAEEMTAVLQRHVCPVSLPSSMPASCGHGTGSEDLRERHSLTVSNAAASLAPDKRKSEELGQLSVENIINPYTGHMEPRDNVSDLSPVKQNQCKSHKTSLTESFRTETVASRVSQSTPMSMAAERTIARTCASDSVQLDIDSFHSRATVPSSLGEERLRGFPSSTITSISLTGSSHGLTVHASMRRHPDVSHARLSTAPSILPLSAASHIYAQQPCTRGQPLLQTTSTDAQHSSHTHLVGSPMGNGPLGLTTLPSHRVSPSHSPNPGSQLQIPGGVYEGDGHNFKHLPLHRALLGDVIHSVSASSGAETDGISSSQVSGGAGSQQSVTVSSLQPLTCSVVPVSSARQEVTHISAVSAQAQSDTVLLLNCSSSAAQRLPDFDAESVAMSSTSPAELKHASDGEDSSNHSGISPVSTIAPAPSSLLDPSGTKIENHDSGLGSSSERSDDTTPSEMGDGEFQTSVAAVDPSTSDSSGGKPAMVTVMNAVLNCKDLSGSTEPPSYTVGYVQLNQHTTDLSGKEMNKFIAGRSPFCGEKPEMQGAVRLESGTVKTMSSWMTSTSQGVHPAHKEAGMTLSAPARTNNVQHQLHGRMCDITPSCQNGPPLVLPEENDHLHLVKSVQSAVYSPAATVSDSQGQAALHHPLSAKSHGQALLQPGKANSHTDTGWLCKSSPTHNSLTRVLHFSPSQTVRSGLQTVVTSSVVQNVAFPVSYCGTDSTASISSCTAVHSSSSSAEPLLYNKMHLGDRRTEVSHQEGCRSVNEDVTCERLPLVGGAKMPSQVEGATIHGADASASVASDSIQNVAVHHASVVMNHVQHEVSSSGSACSVSITKVTYSPSKSSAVFGAVSQVTDSLVASSHNQPHAAATVPSSHSPSMPKSQSQCLVQTQNGVGMLSKHHSSPAIFEASVRAVSSTRPQSVDCIEPLQPGSQPVSSAFNFVSCKDLPSSTTCVAESNGRVICTAATSTSASSDGILLNKLVKQAAPLFGSSPGSPIPGLSADLGLDLVSDLLPEASLNDIALLEATSPQCHEGVFDTEDDDLALLTEPGLSAYLDVGGRHGVTNGSVGVSAEVRAGSNITSIYTKRSSPINVNMLNHLYAAGLPQPRRLTESVQRLVKPLLNHENSLLPGRTCKSPSSSSRHGSNGSASPGRASQSGTKSPGAGAGSVVRNLFDRMAVCQALIISSCADGVISSPSTVHVAHAGLGGSGVNCLNTAVIPAAPHPLATLQLSASSRCNTGNSHTSLPSTPVSAAALSSSVPNVTNSVSVHTTTAPVSSLPSSVTVTALSSTSVTSLSCVSDASVTLPSDSLLSGFQLESDKHVNAPLSRSLSSAEVTLPHHHPQVTDQAELGLMPTDTVQEDTVASSLSSDLSQSSAVVTVTNHTGMRLSQQTVPPEQHGPPVSVSVCNTSRLESVSRNTGTYALSGSSTPSSASSSPSASLPLVCSTLSALTQQLQHVPDSTLSLSQHVIVPESSVPSCDLSSHGAIGATERTLTMVAVTSSVHVSSVSAASVSAEFVATPKFVTESSSHSVTADIQCALTSVGKLVATTEECPAASDTVVSSCPKGSAEHTVETSSDAHNVTPVLSQDSHKKKANSELTEPYLLPSENVTKQRENNITQSSAECGQHLKGPSPHSSSVTAGCAVSNAVNDSDPAVLHNICPGKEGGEKAQILHAVNRHVIPSPLQPAPPVSLPAVMASAAPPPPALDPVHASSIKELSSEAKQNPTQSSSHGCDMARATLLFSSSHQTLETGVPVSLTLDSTNMMGKGTLSEKDLPGGKDGESQPKNDPSSDGQKVLSASVVNNCPHSADDVDDLNAHRLKRKRKSPYDGAECSDGNSLEVEQEAEKKNSDHKPVDDTTMLQLEARKGHLGEAEGQEKRLEEKDLNKGEPQKEEKDNKEEEVSRSKHASHQDRNILNATPEEVAKRVAAGGGRRRVHYTYVLDLGAPAKSYFDTPVLSGRTRSQGSKGQKEGPMSGTPVSSSPASAQLAAQSAKLASKEETGETTTSVSGAKRSTRSLRAKDAGETSQAKRKRFKEPR